MLNKIALATFKYRFKDFLILFTGLIISVSVFLMFSNLANNNDFLIENSGYSMIVFVFLLGQFLLALITFIYINFANNFFRELRQREYGLLMMLGANTRQIANLLMKETLLIGFLSIIIGIFLGTGLTTLSGVFLQKLLHLKLQGFEVINIKGLCITVTFFVLLYIVNGLLNRYLLNKTDINVLLKGKSSENEVIDYKRLALKSVFGVLSLSAGFWFMMQFSKMGFLSLIIALILNVVGTYFFVSSSLIFIFSLIKNFTYFQRGLGNFIIGQLGFRLQAFNRILTIVSLIFALAYGALSIGIGYQKSMTMLSKQNNAYSIALNNPDRRTNEIIQDLKGINYTKNYYYKVVGDTVVWDEASLNENGLPTATNGVETTYSLEQLRHDVVANEKLEKLSSDIEAKDSSETNPKIDINVLDQTNINEIVLVSVNDIEANEVTLSKLYEIQLKNSKYVSGSYSYLRTARSLFGGLEFMGFFLSIAFLAMLASTLMFKVLSNARSDMHRYEILDKIGTTRKRMINAVRIEIGVIFGVPAIIGTLDVAVGLNMFKPIMLDPYIALLPSTLIIFIFYLTYYIITARIYWKMLKR